MALSSFSLLTTESMVRLEELSGSVVPESLWQHRRHGMAAFSATAPLQRVRLAVKMSIRTRQEVEVQEAPGAKGELA